MKRENKNKKNIHKSTSYCKKKLILVKLELKTKLIPFKKSVVERKTCIFLGGVFKSNSRICRS